MNVYIWKNKRTKSDYTDKNTLRADHSSCLVVLAKNEQTAIKIALTAAPDEFSEEPETPHEIQLNFDGNGTMPKELKEGIICYASGDC